MTFGGSPLDKSGGNVDKRMEKLLHQADIDRAAREAGHVSPLRRFLRRLRRGPADVG